MKKIFIGSCGGLTGFYLAKSFKKYEDIIVFGGDVSPQNPTKFIVDVFKELPPANEHSFIEELLNFLNSENIDIYLPTHSSELHVVAKHEEEIRANYKGFFMVSPPETYRMLDDKVSMNHEFRAIGIPVPQIYTKPTDENVYPLFMKPNVGSGSNNNFIVTSRKLHEVLLEDYPYSTCFQKISGEEVTVDCMFDGQGKLLGYNQRQRIKNMGGATIITSNSNFIDIFPFIDKIANKFLFKGCVNFQYILEDKNPYFIDANLRYASGGLPLSVDSGLNIPQMILDLACNKAPVSFKGIYKKNTMYRYFEEFFEEDNDVCI